MAGQVPLGELCDFYCPQPTPSNHELSCCCTGFPLLLSPLVLTPLLLLPTLQLAGTYADDYAYTPVPIVVPEEIAKTFTDLWTYYDEQFCALTTSHDVYCWGEVSAF